MKNDIKIMEYIKGFFDKYKYPALVFAIGLVLVTGEGLFAGKTEKEVVISDTDSVEAFENKICEALERVEGIGEVEVRLSVETGAHSVYATDSAYGNEGHETVIINGASGQTPLVEYENAPVFRGAVIVCQGADSSKVRLEVTNAVKALTGISSDNIVILKMKN